METNKKIKEEKKKMQAQNVIKLINTTSKYLHC
jgi:hypothetical protein